MSLCFGKNTQPRNMWQDKVAYDSKARELAQLFIKNFTRFSEDIPLEIVAAGPIL